MSTNASEPKNNVDYNLDSYYFIEIKWKKMKIPLWILYAPV